MLQSPSMTAPARRLAVPLLYAIFFTAAIALVAAANRQELLTKEEASSGFVNPAFLEFRLEHHVFSTNFYAYLYLWFASHLVHGLFYARFAKAAIMALLPCFIYLYLRKAFEFGELHAFFAALAIGFLPGYSAFSWIGMDTGMETPIGWCALWLALFDTPLAILASSFFAALSAETYGGGVVFLIVVAASHLFQFHRSRRPVLLAGLGVMLAVLLVPVFWWTNVQTLLTGGAGDPSIRGSGGRLVSLAQELFLRGDSYYFFNQGAPALGGGFIELLAITGLVAAILRDRRRTWPLLLILILSLGMYAAAGNVSGVRRVIPLVVCLGVFACLFLNSLALSRVRSVRAAAYLAVAIWLAMVGNEYHAIREGLASGRMQLPRDFEFRIPPGQTMAGTVARLLNGSLALPADLAGFEPDRTLSILYVLGKPSPRYSPQEIIRQCDAHGWSIPSNAPRFVRVRKHLRMTASRP